MTFIPFMLGATCYEAQFGRLGIRFLRPKMWCRRMNFPLTVYWTDKEGNIQPKPFKYKKRLRISITYR